MLITLFFSVKLNTYIYLCLTLKIYTMTYKLETIEFNSGKITPVIIEKSTQNECFTEFFRLNNSLKYCNGHHYNLINELDKTAYSNWFSIENYYKNGGCMW